MVNYKIKREVLNSNINFPVCLAPMVGLSHVALRTAIRRYLPSDALTIWPTEMLSSRRLPHEQLNRSPEVFFSDTDLKQGLVPQILGNNEHEIALSVAKLKSWGAQAIDINMGCPVAKALRHNYGVSLMGDIQYAKSIVEMTVRNTDLPVSVKLRAGLQNDPNFLLDFVHSLESAGASWICLHPRLAHQKRRGYADWSQIKFVRENLKIPVIGNGDIQIAQDVLAMIEQTDCDMVMIGRALTVRPWILWQVGKQFGFSNPIHFSENQNPPKNSIEEGYECGRHLLFTLEQFKIYFNENIGIRKFQFLLKNACPWLEFGHTLQSMASRAKNYSEMQVALESFFSREQSMSHYTDLRY